MLIATHKRLNVNPVIHLRYDELIVVDIYQHNKKVLSVLTIYNPNFKELNKLKCLLSSLEILIENKENFLLTGDFNLPNAFPYSLDKSTGKKYVMFYDFIAKIHPVTQCINFQTRGLNILDLIFISDTSKLSNITCHPPIHRSDHNLMFGNYNIQKLISYNLSKNF